VPLNKTVLLPCVVPKWDPLIVTTVPAGPAIGLRLLIVGDGVTVKLTPLLATDPTVAITLPVLAPEGTEVTRLVSLQLVGTTGMPLKVTELNPFDAPKLLPLIVTGVPTGPEDGLKLAITGDTAKFKELLATPPTVTRTAEMPATAPTGTEATMLVVLQLLAVPADTPLNVTVLVPCDPPKFAPAIVTEVPTGPLLGVKLVMLGGGLPRFVSEKFTVVNPVAAAVTVYGPPPVAFAVNGADATPDAFVAKVIVAVLLLNTPDAPDPGAVNVTFTPETGLLPASFTVTANAFAKAVLIVADCGVVPAFAVIVEAAPTVFVSEKFAVASPVAAAVTVYGPPAVAFAVNGADATPVAFVASVMVAVLLLNTPDAPDPGAVNVTFTPETGLLPASFTVTASAFANAVLIVADCGVVPAFAVIVEGAPTVFVSEKFAGVITPETVAATL
jgi:hypothetical protein